MANDKHRELAEQILPLVGGKENIVSATHCMTRLRLQLKDFEKADIDGLKDSMASPRPSRTAASCRS